MLQTSQRLARCEFHYVPVRIAHHCEVTNHAANIYRLLDQNVLLAGELGDPVDFFPRITLKTKVIEARLYFILHDYQNEDWIFTLLRWRAEPDIVATLYPPVANDRETAKRSIEVD